MTATWLQICLAAGLTSATMLAIFVILLRFEEFFLSMQFQWAESISDLLNSNSTNNLVALAVYSLVVGMPYVLLTLIAFIISLRLICRSMKLPSVGIPDR